MIKMYNQEEPRPMLILAQSFMRIGQVFFKSSLINFYKNDTNNNSIMSNDHQTFADLAQNNIGE